MPRLSDYSRDLFAEDLANMFQKLKDYDGEAFDKHTKQVNAALADLSTAHSRLEEQTSDYRNIDAEVLRAQQKVHHLVLDVFDSSFLTKLYAQIAGSTRWKRVLHELELPLDGLEKLRVLLKSNPNQNTVQSRLISEVCNLLSWLSPGEPSSIPASSASSSYRDSSLRHNAEAAMQQQLDEQMIRLGERPTESLRTQTQADRSASQDDEASRLRNREGRQDDSNSISNDLVELIARSDKRFENARLSDPSVVETCFKMPSQSRQSPTREADTAQPSPEQQSGFCASTAAVAQQYAQNKTNEIANWQQQKAMIQYKRNFINLQAYSTIISQNKHFRDGGPPPNLDFIEELGMREPQACLHRLKALWEKQAAIIQECQVQKLHEDLEIYLSFALCVREAYCLFHMLLYHGTDRAAIVNFGWELAPMRRLQAKVADYAHEEPLKHSKIDIDAVCYALQDIHDYGLRDQCIAPNVWHSNGQTAQTAHVAQRGQAPSYPAVQSITGTQHFLGVQGNSVQNAIPNLATDMAYLDGDADMMDLDAGQVCSYFLSRGGCTKVNAKQNPCHSEHPASMKKFINVLCPHLLKGRPCKYGSIGCQYSHAAVGRDANQQCLHQTSAIANPAISDDAIDSPVIAAAPIGKILDAGLAASYCRDHGRGRCPRRNTCPYLHAEPYPDQHPANGASGTENMHSNFSNNNVFQSGRQGAQPAAQQLPTSQKPCKFLAQGSCKFTAGICKWSHDPAVFAQAGLVHPEAAQQVFEDDIMGDILSDEDDIIHMNTGRRPASETPCRYENNGRFCSNPNCNFLHLNPNSAFYYGFEDYAADTEQAHPQQQQQNSGRQNSHRGGGAPRQRAQNDYTYETQHPVVFAQPQNVRPQRPDPLVQIRQHIEDRIRVGTPQVQRSQGIQPQSHNTNNRGHGGRQNNQNDGNNHNRNHGNENNRRNNNNNNNNRNNHNNNRRGGGGGGGQGRGAAQGGSPQAVRVPYAESFLH
jgi:hypothetical protein